jgi:Tol biopolymer transport system component
MGEVYRARDPRLERDVAIKVLPADVATDPERLARFEREARLLASLSHPNVGAIFGLERSGDSMFLALELVEGNDLSERLAGGALSTREALQISCQIARAIEAAHERGIIHRDLKPSNVKVTPNNTVKVLDFGLAKMHEASAPSATDSDQSPTLAPDRTEDGVILGTAAYMSPEQARGQALDTRSDIWAFGCVLYEALTGQPAFARATVSDSLVAILGEAPDWDALPADTPADVRRLLRRCLAKDLDRRLHHAADARIALEEALEGIDDEAPVLQDAPAAGAGGLGLGAVAAVAAIALAAGYGINAFVGGEAKIAPPEQIQEVTRVTHDTGVAEWPTWSNDGELLAFSSNRDGNFDIYVRRVDGGDEINVTDHAADDFQPAFSPDGEWIAFVSTRSSTSPLVKIGATFGMEFRTYGGDIWVAPPLGGRARRLAPSGNSPAWASDSRSVIYVSGPELHRSIEQVSLEGEVTTLLATDDSDWEIVRLHYSPDGRWITFDTAINERAWIMPAEGGPVRELLSGISHVWAPDGNRLYYMSRDPAGGTRLLSVAVDPGAGEILGEPVTVGLMTGLLRDLTLARDGTSFSAVELEGSLNLTLLPLDAAGAIPAGPERELSRGQVIDRYPRFSPDGRTLAVASNRLGNEEVWTVDRETGSTERLELPGVDQGANLPYFSQDGADVFVTRVYSDGTRSLWRVALDGSGAEELVSPRAGLQGAPMSPDGTRVMFSAPSGAYAQLFTVDVVTGEITQLTNDTGDKAIAEWFPDGSRVVFGGTADGPVQLYDLDLETGAVRKLTDSSDRIRHAFYSPDGRWLYFQPNHLNVYRMPADGGEAEPVTTFPESGLFLEEPTLSPDGRTLAYSRSNGGSSVWVLRTDSGQRP